MRPGSWPAVATITVNGPSKIYAVDNRDFTPHKIIANSYAAWATDGGQIVFNGETDSKLNPSPGRNAVSWPH